jgi:hypothetical protein
MPRFVKIAAEVEAFHYESSEWHGGHEAALFAWRDDYGPPGTLHIQAKPGGGHILWIAKSKTWTDLEAPQWIIAESDGSGFYPCAEDVFASAYERVAASSGLPGESRKDPDE